MRARDGKKGIRKPATPVMEGRSVKVAIDLPASLFKETENAMQELSVNRSSLIRSALEMFLRHRERDKLERAIAQSFSANRDLDRQLTSDFRHVDADEGGLPNY